MFRYGYFPLSFGTKMKEHETLNRVYGGNVQEGGSVVGGSETLTKKLEHFSITINFRLSFQTTKVLRVLKHGEA